MQAVLQDNAFSLLREILMKLRFAELSTETGLQRQDACANAIAIANLLHEKGCILHLPRALLKHQLFYPFLQQILCASTLVNAWP